MTTLDTWLETAPPIGSSVGEFVARDGAKLGFTGYRTDAPAETGTALVYLHGIESHAGWFEQPAELLQQRGYHCFCLDRRGSGINRDDRAFLSGDTPSLQTLFDDVRTFRDLLRGRFERVFLVGLSWGGKLGTGYVLGHPKDFDGLILITPGLAAKVDVSPRTKVGIFFALLLSPTRTFKLPIEPEMFTDTPRFVDYIRQDPLRIKRATARFLYASRKLDGYIAGRVGEIKTPTQLFLAGEDRIIDNNGVLEIVRHAEPAGLEVHTYEDLQHSIQFEAPQRLVDDMTAWIARQATA